MAPRAAADVVGSASGTGTMEAMIATGTSKAPNPLSGTPHWHRDCQWQWHCRGSWPNPGGQIQLEVRVATTYPSHPWLSLSLTRRQPSGTGLGSQNLRATRLWQTQAGARIMIWNATAATVTSHTLAHNLNLKGCSMATWRSSIMMGRFFKLKWMSRSLSAQAAVTGNDNLNGCTTLTRSDGWCQPECTRRAVTNPYSNNLSLRITGSLRLTRRLIMMVFPPRVLGLGSLKFKLGSTCTAGIPARAVTRPRPGVASTASFRLPLTLPVSALRGRPCGPVQVGADTQAASGRPRQGRQARVWPLAVITVGA